MISFLFVGYAGSYIMIKLLHIHVYMLHVRGNNKIEKSFIF